MKFEFHLTRNKKMNILNNLIIHGFEFYTVRYQTVLCNKYSNKIKIQILSLTLSDEGSDNILLGVTF